MWKFFRTSFLSFWDFLQEPILYHRWIPQTPSILSDDNYCTYYGIFFMVRRRTTDSLDPLKRSGNTAPKFLNSISYFPSVSLSVFVDHKSFEAKRSSKKQHKSQLLFSMPIFSSRYIIQKIFFHISYFVTFMGLY